MKFSEYITILNDFQRHFGDVDLEFWLRERDNEGEVDPTELDLHEVHDGYNSDDSSNTITVCEIRLSKLTNDPIPMLGLL